MRREIISIDQEKCNGCGLCAEACAEGAIEIVDGKARLVSDAYCDGLGKCLGECPEGAIRIEVRDVAAFDEEAVKEHLDRRASKSRSGFACPGSAMRQFGARSAAPAVSSAPAPASELTQWPVQLALVPPSAPFLEGADLLLVADCVPFALADFHARFLRGRALLVGCPKLDDTEPYVEKLTEILRHSGLKSLTVIHMEVPCCSGLTRIAANALVAAGAAVPVRDVTVSLQGEVIAERVLSQGSQGTPAGSVCCRANR
jgi:Pyruvate/2-oxoacid:ferredoxin oxidoreductase delta subunit